MILLVILLILMGVAKAKPYIDLQKNYDQVVLHYTWRKQRITKVIKY